MSGPNDSRKLIFFFNDTATTEIYTLSLHDALPILPTAVTIASRDGSLARAFTAALGTARFRPYLSQDPIGVEIGGAVKNVLAIACGIVEDRKSTRLNSSH